MNASIAGAHKNKTVTPFRIMLKEGLCSTRTHKHTHTYTHTHTHTQPLLSSSSCSKKASAAHKLSGQHARTHARTHTHTHTHTHTLSPRTVRYYLPGHSPRTVSKIC